MEGFRLPLQWRGVRTTLVSGVLTYNEVETSPRHHVQRRAHPVYPRPPGAVKGFLAARLLLGHDGVEELTQRAESCDRVFLRGGALLVPRGALLVARGALVAQAEHLVGDVQRGQRQHLGGVLSRARAIDLPRALLDVAGQLAHVLGRGLAADGVLLAEDVDFDPVLVSHRPSPFAPHPTLSPKGRGIRDSSPPWGRGSR